MTLLEQLRQILSDLDGINQLDPVDLKTRLAEGVDGERPVEVQAGSVLSAISQVTRSIAERAEVSHIQVVSRITSSNIQIGPPEDGAPAE